MPRVSEVIPLGYYYGGRALFKLSESDSTAWYSVFNMKVRVGGGSNKDLFAIRVFLIITSMFSLQLNFGSIIKSRKVAVIVYLASGGEFEYPRCYGGTGICLP